MEMLKCPRGAWRNCSTCYRDDERGEAAPVPIDEMQRPTGMDVEHVEEEEADRMMRVDERNADAWSRVLSH